MGIIYKNGGIYYQKDDNDKHLPPELERRKYLLEGLAAALKCMKFYREKVLTDITKEKTL